MPESKRYQIIYADPAWGAYKDKCHAGQRGAGYKYGTLSMDDLRRFQVKRKFVANIAAEDCALFLWVTAPLLLDPGLPEVIRSWGFEYKTIAFVWVKLTKLGKRFHWGMGSYTRANAEYCLICTRGRPKRLSAGVHQIIEAPVREHSRKPDIVRDKIVELYGDVPRIELFAREAFPGWDHYGNEVGKFNRRAAK